jgi:hypothetical protein
MKPERGVWISDPAGRHDLMVFAERSHVLDEAAVIRLRTRADGLVGAWVATGFDVLAGRAVAGKIQPADVTCAADELARGLRAVATGGYVDPGYPLDSAWRGALPAETGFVHVEDVPATVLADLALHGAELARDSGGHGPPASLLDSAVLQVSGNGASVGVPMRCVLALAAMRFLPEDPPDAEVVRIRTSPAWLRIDARFGSVFRRRGGPALLVR